MRIRTIKPEFWTDEKVAELGPWAMLVFVGLLNMADDYGLVEFSPRRIKNTLFPDRDGVDVEEATDELINQDMVFLYDVDDTHKVLAVKNFQKHQRIAHLTKPKIPWPFPEWGDCGNWTSPPIVNAPGDTRKLANVREDSRKLALEGKGREGNSPLTPQGGKKTPQQQAKEKREADRLLVETAFAAFWEIYPRKDAKPRAFKAFKAQKCVEHMEAIIARVQWQKKHEDTWLKSTKEDCFIPLPATWLNARRWEDEGLEALGKRQGPLRHRYDPGEQD